jgi:hypothetical protein
MSPAEARRRKVLAMLARDGVQYAILVEDANTDPAVLMTVGTPDGTREVLIPRDQYDPFEVLAKVNRWDTGRRERDPASGGIVITEAELEAARSGRIGVPGDEP